MKRKIFNALFFISFVFQGMTIGESYEKKSNKKNTDEEYPHKANELYNQGDIPLVHGMGNGIFQNIASAILNVHPNSTIAMSLLDEFGQQEFNFEFIDGKRMEDSREIITYTGSMYIMDHSKGSIPTLRAIANITIHDYQFTKDAKNLDYLVHATVVYEEMMENGNPQLHQVQFKGLPKH